VNISGRSYSLQNRNEEEAGESQPYEESKNFGENFNILTEHYEDQQFQFYQCELAFVRDDFDHYIL
jgi:hypothetical protein